MSDFEQWLQDNCFGMEHPNGDMDVVVSTDDIRMYFNSTSAEIARLTKELEEARKDTDRLNSGIILTQDRDDFGDQNNCLRTGIDLRAAIDAAIRQIGGAE